jgi:aerobic-type carbon monoxide dehydrogenase small subunit (CoxS/CutS family)
MDTSTKPTAVAVSRIALAVNGQPRQLELDPRASWLDALREHLHLTGTSGSQLTSLVLGVFVSNEARDGL